MDKLAHACTLALRRRHALVHVFIRSPAFSPSFILCKSLVVCVSYRKEGESTQDVEIPSTYKGRSTLRVYSASS